ncbi:hypothetical protein SteCoe_10911 [Stentor coeruleus]|uniref:Protein kinase domain-containing protein n=1 Tax=Stentor coeruleus TaxID=5963 RepID=A0A1R2CEH9_9CILI|nr:hypothetical protein SteCoe_10911 [Stentor coeruleus]
MKLNKIYHSDIKPHSFLVDSSWNVKIIDFSVAIVKNEDITSNATGNLPIQGTKGYTSPKIETVNNFNQEIILIYPEKSDVFSLGLLILQILKKINAEGCNRYERKAELDSIINTINFEWARNLLKQMLNLNPSLRLDFSSLLNLIPV